ncbi:MAG: hypothetical protein Q9213_001990 [Squamulea squamosa]
MSTVKTITGGLSAQCKVGDYTLFQLLVQPRMSGSTYYFAYGSNLWLQQMALRCPSSYYVGIARLTNYRWIINNRGYANIVQSTDSTDIVYGLVYKLTGKDEKQLDLNEGVPWAYTKETMSIDFWPSKHGEELDLARDPEKTQLLVYIDRKRVDEHRPRDEYVHRINMGVHEVVKMGIPQRYVDDVIRKFIPTEGGWQSKRAVEIQR